MCQTVSIVSGNGLLPFQHQAISSVPEPCWLKINWTLRNNPVKFISPCYLIHLYITVHKIWIELNWNWKKINWIGIELKDSESDLNWNWIELKNPESNLNWNWIELKEMNWSEPCLWVPSNHCGDVVPGKVLPLCWVIWMCRCFDPLFWHSGDWSRSFWGTFSHPLTPKWSFGVLKLPILTEFDLFGPKFRFSLDLFGSNFQRPVVHPHQFSDRVPPRGCSYLGPSGFGGPAGSRVVTVTQEAPQANPNMPNLLLSTVWIFRRIIQRIIRQNFQQFHGGCY